jgi:photosystem II stability/assembly factor-like uncharacterized protein
MLDKKNGWGLTAQNVLRTADGGSQWMEVTPPGLGEPASPPHGFFLNLNTAWILVPRDENFNLGALYRTTDAGKTWNPTALSGISGVYSLISMEDMRVWDGETLMVTQDGGKTWQRIKPNVNLSQMISQLDFVSKDTAWVIATNADGKVKLLDTTDGGGTWTHVH